MGYVKLLDEGKFFEIQKRNTRSDSLEKESTPSVSYTHLTLPTICSV